MSFSTSTLREFEFFLFRNPVWKWKQRGWSVERKFKTHQTISNFALLFFNYLPITTGNGRGKAVVMDLRMGLCEAGKSRC